MWYNISVFIQCLLVCWEPTSLRKFSVKLFCRFFDRSNASYRILAFPLNISTNVLVINPHDCFPDTFQYPSMSYMSNTFFHEYLKTPFENVHNAQCWHTHFPRSRCHRHPLGGRSIKGHTFPEELQSFLMIAFCWHWWWI